MTLILKKKNCSSSSKWILWLILGYNKIQPNFKNPYTSIMNTKLGDTNYTDFDHRMLVQKPVIWITQE